MWLRDAVALVPHRGVDVGDADVVDSRDPFAWLAGGDKFGDCLGAGAADQGGLAEAMVRIKDYRGRAAEGVEAASVPSAVIIEVDFLQKRCGGIGEL